MHICIVGVLLAGLYEAAHHANTNQSGKAKQNT
jgi:hypothetical protein